MGLLKELENSVDCEKIERKNTENDEKRPGIIEYGVHTKLKYFGHMTNGSKYRLIQNYDGRNRKKAPSRKKKFILTEVSTKKDRGCSVEKFSH